MKKIILTLAVTTLMAGTLFTGCGSSDSKVEAAQSDVMDAKQDLKEAKQDANEQADKYASAEEWKTFKSETAVKIKDNETRIAELKEKMQNSGKTLDAMRTKKIADLEKQNRDLRSRMDAYNKNQTDWETFKREFNHDMDEMEKALKGLTVDNKK